MEQTISEGVQYRILVVDDEPDTARLAREWLDSGAFQVLEASDGQRGFEIATRENPDVILLDLRMPGIDGISVAKQLKEDARTRAIPIMVLSACRDLDAKVQAFRAGADDYLSKPFVFQEVHLRIESLLRTRQQLVSLESTIKDLSNKNEHLEERLMVDDKTGLYNFRAFQRKLAEEWQRAKRYTVPLSLVFLDIDQFKRVNDTLGHPAGDRVLEEFSTLVTGGARANDVAARYGGEEFAVVLPHTDAEMAVRVAERIRRAVQEFVFLESDTPTQITVSAGVATMPTTPGVDSMDALVRAADEALLAAKDLGRNRVVEAGTDPE